MAGKKVGSDGQIRKTTAEWAADTATYPEGMRLMDTDTGVVRVSKGTTYALAWVPASSGGGDYSPPIPKSDVTDLEGDLTAIVAQAARDRHPVITFSTNTTTNADPGQATIRFNNGTIASVTEIALSDVDSESVDKGDLNSRFGGIIQLRPVVTTGTIEFQINSVVHTTWTRYTVTYLKGTLPANGTVCAVRFLPKAQPKTYVALLTQSGTDAPVATVLENTLGGTVVYSYSQTGIYDGTLSLAFPSNKTVTVINGGGNSGSLLGSITRLSDNAFRVYSFDGGSASDDMLSSTEIIITVYP